MIEEGCGKSCRDVFVILNEQSGACETSKVVATIDSA